MDLIYLIVITPITIAVMFVYWKLKQYFRDFDNLPEASPYEFEKDQYLPGFDAHTRTIFKHKFYKGKSK